MAGVGFRRRVIAAAQAAFHCLIYVVKSFSHSIFSPDSRLKVSFDTLMAFREGQLFNFNDVQFILIIIDDLLKQVLHSIFWGIFFGPE